MEQKVEEREPLVEPLPAAAAPKALVLGVTVPAAGEGVPLVLGEEEVEWDRVKLMDSVGALEVLGVRVPAAQVTVPCPPTAAVVPLG